MKIAFIADQNTYGGAYIALNRLAEAFRESGHTVQVYKLVFFAKQHLDISSHEIEIELAHDNKLVRIGRWLLRMPREIYTVRSSFIREINSSGYDFVSIHNLHGSRLDPSFMFSIDIPILWTFHDMWPFTGRCAYSAECIDYVASQCGNLCPSWRSYPVLSPSKIALMQQTKQFLLNSKLNLIGICPSNWMFKRAQDSGIKSTKLATIPNSLPSYFLSSSVQDKVIEKVRSTVTTSHLKVGFAAQNINDPRKGMKYVLKVLQALSFEVEVRTMGSDSPSLPENINFINLGSLIDPCVIAQFYLDLDVFLCLSTEDNFPNTAIEAMALGVCVIASKNTGLSDLITNGHNGYLVDVHDTNSICSIIENLHYNPSLLSRIRVSAVDSTIKSLSPKNISDLHISQYQSLRSYR